ncbi:MAG TPA: nucleotidyltransferase [Chitinispirillaceae bacterium]|nr:nucleotidyltransferase [Chitinispirillaceae bacterium]
MNIQPDFEELLKLLECHKVRYMIVGGYAVAFHGFPRFTKDIDIYYSDSDENIANLKKALLDFGFQPHELPDELFKTKGNIITFGIEPIRIDLLNEIDGVEFENAWLNHLKGNYGNTEVNFISKIDLIKNKSSTSHLQDKSDAEKLSP